MEATARDHTTDPAPSRLGPPPLVVVPDRAEPRPEPNVGRTAIIGALVGFVLATAAVTVASVVGGLGAGSALGLGAFVGLWGGVGFGFMMGGTVPLARYLDTNPHGQASAPGAIEAP